MAGNLRCCQETEISVSQIQNGHMEKKFKEATTATGQCT